MVFSKLQDVDESNKRVDYMEDTSVHRVDDSTQKRRQSKLSKRRYRVNAIPTTTTTTTTPRWTFLEYKEAGSKI